MITEILSKVLPVLVMIALGRLCETKQIINDEQHAGLKAIVGDILLPVVLFQAFFTADYGKRMLLVFVLVFVGYGAALAAGYALRRFVKPYDRFMPLLMNADDPQQLAPSLKQLLSYHVAGVIITSGAPPLSLAEEYLARKIPVTLINRHADLTGCDRVCSDNAQGAKLVADLFSRRGWRQVGFIGENRENFSTRQRYEAFIARTSDMAVSSRFCDGGGYQAGYQAARELVAENPGMQALFCATDMLALGAQDGLRDAAAPLPAIVGFDDIPQADWQPYQLTTVQQNTALLAHHAVDLLMTRIARFSLPSRHREVQVKLIIRHSAK